MRRNDVERSASSKESSARISSEQKIAAANMRMDSEMSLALSSHENLSHEVSGTNTSRSTGHTNIKKVALQRQVLNINKLKAKHNTLRIALKEKVSEHKMLASLRLDMQEEIKAENMAKGISAKDDIGDRLQKTKERHESIRRQVCKLQTYTNVLGHLYDRTRRYNIQMTCESRTIKDDLILVRNRLSSLNLVEKDALNTLNTQKREQYRALADLELQLRDANDEHAHVKQMLQDLDDVERDREIEKHRGEEIAAEVMGDLTVEGEHRLQKKLVANKFVREKVSREVQNTNREISEYEVAFDRIMEATGLSNPIEVLDKYSSQLDTRTNLENMICESSEKIEKIKARRLNIAKEAEQMKFSGIVSSHRDGIDKAESTLYDIRKQRQSAVAQIAKSEGLIAKLIHGVQTLVNKLDALPSSISTSHSEMHGQDPSTLLNPGARVTRATLMQSLASCVQRFTRLVENTPESSNEIDDLGMHVILNHFLSNNVKVDNRNVRRKSMAVVELPPKLSSSKSLQSEESSSDTENDDADNPVLGDSDGRLRLKAENKRLIQFAEKKRKKLTRMLNRSLTDREMDLSSGTVVHNIIGSNDPHKALEQHVKKLTMIEAKQRKSILKKQNNPKGHPDSSEKVSDSSATRSIGRSSSQVPRYTGNNNKRKGLKKTNNNKRSVGKRERQGRRKSRIVAT